MQLGIMPLHNEESIKRVMNIVSPSDIDFMYRDYGYGAIIEEEAYGFPNCSVDDDIFVIEDMFREECEIDMHTSQDKMNEKSISTDNIFKSSDESFEFRELDEFDEFDDVDDVDDIEKTISSLSSSRFTLNFDTDAISCGGTSCVTSSTSYTRREIPDKMQRSLRHQLALFLKESESASMREDKKSSISKLKNRKRALERSCHAPNFFQSLRSTTVA